ncbi:hypothetical protein GCM10008019_46040 [Deinococcus soli (ex Cha et al. 2016)]|nr:hypothetical protein GCM10008019_46040 [Deinococcus soli (ex Cha et al. 2016)]
MTFQPLTVAPGMPGATDQCRQPRPERRVQPFHECGVHGPRPPLRRFDQVQRLEKVTERDASLDSVTGGPFHDLHDV